MYTWLRARRRGGEEEELEAEEDRGRNNYFCTMIHQGELFDEQFSLPYCSTLRSY